MIVTCEELPETIYRDALNFGWDLRALEEANKLRILDNAAVLHEKFYCLATYLNRLNCTTLLAGEFIKEGLRCGDTCIYMACDEPPAAIREHLLSFKVGTPAYEETGRLVFVDAYEEDIIKNAFDALSDGGKLFIQTDIHEGFVRVAIRDTGVGMDEQTVTNMFDPFFTTKESGTGLGMFITKKIIDNHGGRIKIQSEPERELR